MMKKFEVGKYAINNKGIGIAGPQSTIYLVVSRETIRGVEYVNLLQKLSNGPKVSLLRPIHFNSLQDEEFCYYGRKKRRGYIASYDKESV